MNTRLQKPTLPAADLVAVAHDLNNRLTTITSFAELALALTHADDPRRRYLQQIREAGRGGAELTTQWLAQHPPETIAPSIAPPLRALPRGHATVLLVEDDVDVRDAAAHLLRAQGYTVLEVGSGEAALDLLQRIDGEHIDLVVTDLAMPLMSGKRLAELLHQSAPQLEVLFTSGYTHEALAQAGLDEADAHFLPKPFTADALAAKVRDLLAAHARHEEAA